jgi:hypothetical protein
MDVYEEMPRIRRSRIRHSLHPLSQPPREMHEAKAHANSCAYMPQSATHTSPRSTVDELVIRFPHPSEA